MAAEYPAPASTEEYIETQQAYNTAAPHREDIVSEQVKLCIYASASIIKQMFHYVPILSAVDLGSRIGTGMGHLSRCFHLDLDDEVFGCEIVPLSAETGRLRGFTNLETADVREYTKKLPNGAHTIVFSHHMLEHLPSEADAAKVIQEMFRISSGFVIIGVPVEDARMTKSHYFKKPTVMEWLRFIQDNLHPDFDILSMWRGPQRALLNLIFVRRELVSPDRSFFGSFGEPPPEDGKKLWEEAEKKQKEDLTNDTI